MTEQVETQRRTNLRLARLALLAQAANQRTAALVANLAGGQLPTAEDFALLRETQQKLNQFATEIMDELGVRQ